MKRIFAIGDIHGCSKTFRKLLFDEIGIQVSDEIYCIGDYIDRGPDSKGVLDLILFLRKEGYSIHTLRGNHEQMMLDAINNDKQPFQRWQSNGGDATMKSFGINSLQNLNTDYLNFLNQTGYYFEIPGYILVHAGLNTRNDNIFQDTESMLWTREVDVDRTKLNGRVIIHGHTPQPYDYIMNVVNQPDITSIDIDGGCVYKNKPGFGYLVALSLPGKKLFAVKNSD